MRCGSTVVRRERAVSENLLTSFASMAWTLAAVSSFMAVLIALTL